MQIAYLHQYFNTPATGGSTRSYEMAKRLAAAGHTVSLITTDHRSICDHTRGWKVTQESGFAVHWYARPYSNKMRHAERIRAFIAFAAASAKRLAELPFDVVFASSTPLTVALPAAYGARRNRCPMVFEVRDLWPDVPIALGAVSGRVPIAAARWLERFAYRHAARVVALSPGMRAGVVAAGVDAARVTVIPNSCDFEVFRVPAAAGQRIRADHAWLADRPLVLYAGALGMVNCVGYLVRLAAEVAQLDGSIRFAVIGEGREEAEVRAMANDVGVLDKSLFMMPSLPKPQIANWMSASSITTSTVRPVPALYENSANKFFDSLAAGRPIAINHPGWQAEMITETDCGAVLDAHDLGCAASTLATRVRDEAWLRRAGLAASRLGHERFDRDELAMQLERVLREAVRPTTVPDGH